MFLAEGLAEGEELASNVLQCCAAQFQPELDHSAACITPANLSFRPPMVCSTGALKGFAGSMRNHATYSAGKNTRVSSVATTSPPITAYAIGPQNTVGAMMEQ